MPLPMNPNMPPQPPVGGVGGGRWRPRSAPPSMPPMGGPPRPPGMDVRPMPPSMSPPAPGMMGGPTPAGPMPPGMLPPPGPPVQGFTVSGAAGPGTPGQSEGGMPGGMMPPSGGPSSFAPRTPMPTPGGMDQNAMQMQWLQAHMPQWAQAQGQCPANMMAFMQGNPQSQLMQNFQNFQQRSSMQPRTGMPTQQFPGPSGGIYGGNGG